MKYLIIIPDYTESCIREEFNGEIELNKLGLSKKLVDEFENWQNEYRKIIPLSTEQRIKKIEEIEKLDSLGLRLAEELKKTIPGGAKVKYFSEGKLRYLMD